jgi:YHS domain-containing protein
MTIMEKDPVCGMEVDPKTASAKSDYQGRTYYFCSTEDKRTFDKEPQRYAQSSKERGGSHMRNW